MPESGPASHSRGRPGCRPASWAGACARFAAARRPGPDRPSLDRAVTAAAGRILADPSPPQAWPAGRGTDFGQICPLLGRRVESAGQNRGNLSRFLVSPAKLGTILVPRLASAPASGDGIPIVRPCCPLFLKFWDGRAGQASDWRRPASGLAAPPVYIAGGPLAFGPNMI